MTAMTVEQMRQMLLFVADGIIASKPYLTEVDSKIGDGDHGIGMEIGFGKVKEAVSGKTYGNAAALFQEAGIDMLNSMGGASGVIFSTLFLGGAKGLPGGEEITPSEMSGFFTRSLNAVKARGGASVGDKTMVDALEPACLAMEEISARDCGFEELFAQAETAAQKGMEDTKQMVAKFGRAKSLMDRSLGYQDAGATSVYLMFRLMHQWALQNLSNSLGGER